MGSIDLAAGRYGHAKLISAIAMNSAGTLVASGSFDGHVYLWRFSEHQQNTLALWALWRAVESCGELWRAVEGLCFADEQRIIAAFRHHNPVSCVTFFTDGKHVLSGSSDKILEWAVPQLALPEDAPEEQESNVVSFPLLFLSHV